jgi:hypothetical protein
MDIQNGHGQWTAKMGMDWTVAWAFNACLSHAFPMPLASGCPLSSAYEAVSAYKAAFAAFSPFCSCISSNQNAITHPMKRQDSLSLIQ